MRKISVFLIAVAISAAPALAFQKAPEKSATVKGMKPIEVRVGTAPSQVSLPSSGPLLPDAFAGWVVAPGAKHETDPAAVDAPNAAALKEYGLVEAILADYTRSGETMHVKALRFPDATGAYGAYSFYRKSGWPREQIGTGAASDNNRVLFWLGNVFVDATLPRVAAMSGSELRELAGQIPKPTGNKLLPPPILSSLPQDSIDGQTTHYALGPIGYPGFGGNTNPVNVLPPGLVGFDHGAEVATASYKLRSGPATLTLIEFPTPQLAAAQEKAISAYIDSGIAKPDKPAQHPVTKLLQDSNPASVEVKRSGPLVAIVSGDAIRDESHRLLSEVHYEASLADVPGAGSNDVQKTAQLLLGIILLVVLMFSAALLLAVFLGGGRALFRIARGKPASSMYDQDFTRLDLRD